MCQMVTDILFTYFHYWGKAVLLDRGKFAASFAEWEQMRLALTSFCLAT